MSVHHPDADRQPPAFAEWEAKAGALSLKRQGRELVGPCPACGGTDRFAVKPINGGAALIHCRQCEGFVDILKAAGLADERALNGARRTATTIREFPYLRADGSLVLTVCRREGPDGKKVGDPPVWRKPKGVKGPLPLYRLPDVTARRELPVLIVEGEKTADCGADLFGDRYVVTTTAGGEGKAGHSDLSPLADRDTVIWPDADAPGRKHAEDLARRAIEAGAASVRIVPTDDLPNKWDLADRAPAGLDIEARLASAAPVNAGAAPELPALPERSSWSEPPPPRQWLVPGYMSRGRLSLMSGRGGNGKTKLALQLGTTSQRRPAPASGSRAGRKSTSPRRTSRSRHGKMTATKSCAGCWTARPTRAGTPQPRWRRTLPDGCMSSTWPGRGRYGSKATGGMVKPHRPARRCARDARPSGRGC